VDSLFGARALPVNPDDLDLIAVLLDTGVNHIRVEVPLMSFRICLNNQEYRDYR
jgi:hypothetical protein